MFSAKEKNILKKLKVNTIYFFGSRVNKEKSFVFSDIDFALLFQKYNKNNKNLYYYKEIYKILSSKVKKILKNQEYKPPLVIDIVFLNNAPLELKFEVIKEGKIILDFDKNFRKDFEEKTMLLYMDFKPLLDYIDSEIIER